MRYFLNINDLTKRIIPKSWRGYLQDSYFLKFCRAITNAINYSNIFMYDYSYSKYTKQSNNWVAGVAYPIGSKVVYNFSVYISIQDVPASNINPPYQNTTYWQLYLDNFIGAYDRARYNGSVLSLTYALNKQFGGRFVQPNATNQNSDIYIFSKALELVNYVIDNSGQISSYQGTQDSRYNYRGTVQTTVVGVSPTGAIPQLFDTFFIYVKTSIYYAITGDATQSVSGDSIFINFALQYAYAGFKINIKIY